MADPKGKSDEAGQRAVEGGAGETPDEERPAAGPHAEKPLVDDLKTPGAGTIEEAGEDPSTDATTG
jgi:hypothetical protein